MKTHEFDGATICVRLRGDATLRRYPDTFEVVEDFESSSGRKLWLLKKRNVAVVTEVMEPSEKVEEWWQEQPESESA